MRLNSISAVLAGLALLATACAAEIQIPEGPFYKRWTYKLDDIERYRDKYGQITMQHPSVWGRSRLTQHQEEYEKEMVKQLSSFDLTLQGARSISDQRSFSFGLGIGAGLSGSLPEITNPAAISNKVDVPTNVSNLLDAFSNTLQKVDLPANGLPGFNGATLSLEPTEGLNQRSRYITHLQELRRINEADDAADAPGYAMYLFRMPVSVKPGGLTKKGYGAELSVTAGIDVNRDFLVDTFRHWVINDLVEQLAVPINKLPRATWEARLTTISNETAAVTISDQESRDRAQEQERLAELEGIAAKNAWNEFEPGALAEKLEKLPPRIFGGTPVIQRLRETSGSVVIPESIRQPLRDRLVQVDASLGDLQKLRGNTRPFSLVAISSLLAKHPHTIIAVSPGEFERLNGTPAGLKLLPAAIAEKLELPADKPLTRQQIASLAVANEARLEPAEVQQLSDLARVQIDQDFWIALQAYQANFSAILSRTTNLLNRAQLRRPEIRDLISSLKTTRVFSSEELVPLESLSNLKYPDDLVKQIAETVRTNRIQNFAGSLAESASQSVTKTLEEKPAGKPTATSPGASAHPPFPQEDLARVYAETNLIRMALSVKKEPEENLRTRQELREKLESAYDFIQARGIELKTYLPVARLIATRDFDCLPEGTNLTLAAWRDKFSDGINKCAPTNDTIRLFAWPIVIQILLLDERLRTEVLSLTAEHVIDGVPVSTEDPHFFGKHPSARSVKLFKDFVQNRWPLHVFALDPVTQDQNISDTLSVRRSLQIAVAASIATGKINASQASKYLREIGEDFQTVHLNRTVAAFSEGADTFGWRFHPRFQTARREKDFALEAGMRECVAMVILPSFAPSVRFETRTRWFSLSKPDRTEPSLQKLYDISVKFNSFRENFEKSVEHLLPDDRERMSRLARAYQGVLPMQTLVVRVPFDNASGGSRLVRDGVTSLAPELYGTHGTAVLDTNRVTSVFLVGNNFNIRGTRVLVGGLSITDFTLINRNLIELRLPGHVRVDNGKVKVRIATPYGVSQEEEIPVATKEKNTGAPSTTGPYQWDYQWDNPVLQARSTLAADQKSITQIALTSGIPALAPNAGQIIAPANGSFAFKFYVQTNEGKLFLKNGNQEILKLSDGNSIPISASFGLNFPTVWPQFEAFLKGALNPASLPENVFAQTIFKPEGEKEAAMKNELVIRLTP